MSRVIARRLILCFMLVGLLMGCSGSNDAATESDDPGDATIDPYDIEPSSVETFESVDGEICRIDGKPVIRLFSKTRCSHCQWIAETYDLVVQMYIDEDTIVAHHWEIDTGDDMLTDAIEQDVPGAEMAVLAEFNPDESVPTFVFGCKYYRIGTGYEWKNDLVSEAAEFMAVIEALISA